MRKNLDNEELYLHYFNQLVHFNDELILGRAHNFEILHPSNCNESRSQETIFYLQNKNLRGQASDRARVRKIILEKFQEEIIDFDTFQRTLSELIDFEEELIIT